jgi:hypothetical protein
MKLYHITNGNAYLAPNGMDEKAYKTWVKQAYGSLRGVRFVRAENRNQAISKA